MIIDYSASPYRRRDGGYRSLEVPPTMEVPPVEVPEEPTPPVIRGFDSATNPDETYPGFSKAELLARMSNKSDPTTEAGWRQYILGKKAAAEALKAPVAPGSETGAGEGFTRGAYNVGLPLMALGIAALSKAPNNAAVETMALHDAQQARKQEQYNKDMERYTTAKTEADKAMESAYQTALQNKIYQSQSKLYGAQAESAVSKTEIEKAKQAALEKAMGSMTPETGETEYDKYLKIYEPDQYMAGLKYKTEYDKYAEEQKKKGMDRAQSYRSDYVKETKPNLEVITAYKSYKGQVDSNEGKASPASDLSLVFAFMKALDPTSTVREGEQAQVRDATSALGRVQTMYNRALNGESLNDTQRKDFEKGLHSRTRTYLDNQSRINNRYTQWATDAGLDPSDIVDIYADPGEVSGLGKLTPEERDRKAELEAKEKEE